MTLKLILYGKMDDTEDRVLYSLTRSEDAPGAMGVGVIFQLDEHYVSTENYDRNERVYINAMRKILAIDHELDAAAGKMYRRMRSRARTIAQAENRTVKVQLDENLDDLLKGHR